MCHHSDCGCNRHYHYEMGRHNSCCHDMAYGPRHFRTTEEVIIELEEYLKQLKAEMKGIEERISELKKEN